MATDVPFTSAASLTYPPDDGAAAVARSNSVSGTYQHEAGGTFVLTGSGTQTVDFGSIAAVGAKAIHVEVDPVAAGGVAAPVNIQFNGAGVPGNIEIAQGGHIEIANPIPTAGGILAMDIVHTQDACVKVRILG
jgi:hypothetical protein